MAGYGICTWAHGRAGDCVLQTDCVLLADGGMWFTSICRAGTDSDDEWTE